jgi:hypothetical protein
MGWPQRKLKKNSKQCPVLVDHYNLLHHDEGEDITAQVFNYEVVEWTDSLLHAVAKGAMAECIDRNLFVSLTDQTASLEWIPQEGCEGDIGAAVLVGDPL